MVLLAFLGLALYFPYWWFGVVPFAADNVVSQAEIDRLLAGQDLPDFYAAALAELEPEPFMLFGPAYKGIPLASATAAALADHHQRDVPFAFNRKEVKDHGEGGQLVGAPLEGDVVIVDDVITAGTSIRESVDLIHSAGARAAAVMIALDREEAVTEEGDSAIAHVAKTYGLRVHTLARFSTLLEFLSDRRDLAAHLDALRRYQAKYRLTTPPE